MVCPGVLDRAWFGIYVKIRYESALYQQDLMNAAQRACLLERIYVMVRGGIIS